MKVAVLAALAGSAAAFAPAQHGSHASASALSATEAQKDFFGLASSMDFSKELGVQPPVSFPHLFSSSIIFPCWDGIGSTIFWICARAGTFFASRIVSIFGLCHRNIPLCVLYNPILFPRQAHTV